jgi:molybdenum cofactor synthesis domain-containing protein
MMNTLGNIKAGIIVASDKASRGEREDKCIAAAKGIFAATAIKIIEEKIVSDEEDIISKILKEWSDKKKLDVIFTSGGTGLAPRDVTPEATRKVIDKEVSGISEGMRVSCLPKTPRAMLSRGISGTRGQTLIINLPGSPKAVKECLEIVISIIPHAVETIRGEAVECAECGK